jgi:site-specific DNA-methyltransferase (adenine-specific)
MKDLSLTPFLVADRLRRDGWYLRSTIIWEKPTAVEPMRIDRPAVSHEYLFLLSRSERYYALDPGESWWGKTVWQIGRPPAESLHPAPMPAELVRRCVVAGTKPGDLILDPFAGAATVGQVAARTGRRFIGIELNPIYLEMGRKLVNETMGVGGLFPSAPVSVELW